MPDSRISTQDQAVPVSYGDDMRMRAREAFAASVRAMVGKRQPLAVLDDVGDIELMETATALTRKK